VAARFGGGSAPHLTKDERLEKARKNRHGSPSAGRFETALISEAAKKARLRRRRAGGASLTFLSISEKWLEWFFRVLNLM
jgi:hypothetical protein